jgi:thiol-disulfide isomerase/thioredoxin|uniref:Thioredoxin domain-containing protein n=1 Tax=viral metagenome TaxID=1070528 RepID=A0A6C0BKU3_9ZZZZ
MEDLFQKTRVIKLCDDDFDSDFHLIHHKFKNKDGYVMIYAPWCPNCQDKVGFWSYMAEQFNDRGRYHGENFRIGVISTTDPKAEKCVEHFQVVAIPMFFHVRPNRLGQGVLAEYQGADLQPSSLLAEVCQESPERHLCRLKLDDNKM